MDQDSPRDGGSLDAELRTMVSELGNIPSDFDEKAHFYNDLGVPSVKALRLLVALEDRYGIQIRDEDFVEATSLDALVSLIRRLVP